METRGVRYFVAVAEELHFGGAASGSGSRSPRCRGRLEAVEAAERRTRHAALAPAGLDRCPGRRPDRRVG